MPTTPTVSYRVACAADRLTTKRMGRERAEDGDDEAWDLEWAQAVEDVLTERFDHMRDQRK